MLKLSEPQSKIKTITLVVIFLFAILIFFVLGCNNSKSGNDNTSPRVVRIVAVVTYPDSSKKVIEVWREIVKQVKYDSAAKKDMIVVDTIYATQFFVPLMDSTGKQPLKDSAGNVKADPTPRFFPLHKDSVNWRIENISLDTLLKKS